MTISTIGNQITYAGDGVSLAFAFPYPFITTADLKVYLNGVLQVAGFSVAGTTPLGGSGTFSSGTVTFSVAPALAVVVLIYCDPDLLQSTSLPPNDPFQAKVVEKMIDKITLIVQRLYGKVARAIIVPDGETGTTLTLPAPSVRAGNLLSFDSLGNVIVSAPVAGTATALAADLASSLLPTKNAGQIGFAYALGYGVSTIGKWLQDLALAAGSTFIGWINSGANAVLRTVSNKLRDFANASDYATLTDAFAAADTVFVTSVNYPVISNTTVAKTKRLIILAGGSITVSTGVTLTLNCEVDAPLRQVFAGLGSVVGIRQVCPEWFGAVGTGAVDDIAALDKAHTCVLASLNSAGGRPTIWLKSPQYGVSRGWIVAPTADINLAVIGCGIIYSGSRLVALSTFSPAGPVFQVAGNAGAIQKISDWVVRDLGVVPSAGGYGAATIGIQIGSDSSALSLIGEQQSLIENVFVTGFVTCWKFIHVTLVKVIRCSAWNNGFAGANTPLLITQLGGFTGDLQFDSCQLVGSSATVANTYCVQIISNSGTYNPATGVSSIGGIAFDNCDMYTGKQSIYLFAGSSSWLTDVWFNHCQVDQQTTTAIYVESNNTGSNVQNIHWADGYTAATLGNGFLASATGTGGSIVDVFIHDSWFDRNTLEAVSIFGTTTQGVHINNNSFSNPLYVAGQCVEINGTQGVVISGNMMTRTNGTSTTAYMIRADAGSNHVQVNNNVARGLTTTAVTLDNTGAVTKNFAGNI